MPAYPSTPNPGNFAQTADPPAALTAEDASVVNDIWGAAEVGVVVNVRTRLAEVEQALRDAGLLA